MSLGVILAIAFSVPAFAGGVVCMVRYTKTRGTGVLVGGSLLMFVLPALLFLLALTVFQLSTMSCYAPPESMP